MRMRIGCCWLLLAVLATPVLGADNQLTAKEKKAGWILLFDGKSLDDWMAADGQPSKRPPENGSINPHKAGYYMLVPKKMWEDFILSLDFKITPRCNSGIFVRTFPLERIGGQDVGMNGIEMQIFDSTGAGYYDTGAIYDLVKPTRSVMKPVGEWNHVEITCNKNIIAVQLNGEGVTRIDLDQWTEPNKRPDGTPHKFPEAFKNHPRQGYIGLQDHGNVTWFRNIKIRRLQ